MSTTSFGRCVLACTLAACGSGSTSTGSNVTAAEVTVYQDLADQVSVAAASYRTSIMDPSATLASCAGIHERYDQQVRPLITRMVELGADMDSFMDAHQGASVADMACDADSMMHELDGHARVACSWANLDADRAEVARHVGVMAGYTDHARQRCDEMMAGIDGQGWHWGGMMGGCSGGCGMMGCGGGTDAGVPPDAGTDPLALGQRIFDYGIGIDGQPIPRTGGMMGSYGCAMCHGADGHGRRMMMFTAPNITYANLTDPLGMLEPDGTRGPTYTDALIQRAVVDGIDQDGDTLSTWMPRWQLAGLDWDDLLTYDKTLH